MWWTDGFFVVTLNVEIPEFPEGLGNPIWSCIKGFGDVAAAAISANEVIVPQWAIKDIERFIEEQRPATVEDFEKAAQLLIQAGKCVDGALDVRYWMGLPPD
jgi:hypothetical protein